MKYTKVVTLKITDYQLQTLDKLRGKNIKISNFIREAIKEKIEREYNELIKIPEKVKCPF